MIVAGATTYCGEIMHIFRDVGVSSGSWCRSIWFLQDKRFTFVSFKFHFLFVFFFFL